MVIRLDVRLNDQTAKVLHDASDEDDVSLTETVRRAISFYKLLRDHWRSGGKVILRSANGKQDLEVIQLR